MSATFATRWFKGMPWPFRLSLALQGMVLSLACGGADAPAPLITRFESAPAIVEVGEPATLKVAFSGGEGRVDPLGPVLSGQDVSLAPVASTTYTLTVTSAAGKVARSQATLTVKPGLMVKIEGLPDGLDAAVTVEGPEGFRQTLARTQALKGLKPGKYTILAASVLEGAITRPLLRPSQEVDVTTTGALVKVAYPAPTLTFKLPGDVALDFVLIPPGSFMMGPISPEQTADWPGFFEPHDFVKYALPRHEVTIQKAFYLAKFPVTIRQWKAVMNWTTPDYRSKDFDVPIWDRNWFEWRLEFLPALAKALPGQGFRLPSEAEWEYALRAGSTTKYFWGDDFKDVDTYCWTYDTTVAVGFMNPKVGLKQPNAWGLYDMFSVLQWTEDDTHFSYDGAPSDGSPWIDNPRKGMMVARGGFWSAYTREIDRYWFDSAFRSGFESFPSEANNNGMRPALRIPE